MRIRFRFAGLVAYLGFAVSTPAFAAPADAALPLLIPVPRLILPRSPVPLARGLRLANYAQLGSEDRFALEDLLASLSAHGVRRSTAADAARLWVLAADSPRGRLLLSRYAQPFVPEMRAEGYVLIADRADIYLVAQSSAGVFYAAQTLKQLVTVTVASIGPVPGSASGLSTAAPSAILHRCVVRDWPAMQYRGFQDDLSRGPVPTLEFQKRQLRTLAAYKVNVYSPYFEHTLAYASSPLPALRGGSMSPAEVRELVAYAASYHITVVPEQEAFGHLHNVLIYEQDQQLAETPLGAVLAPGQPGSLDRIGQWFTELAQLFPGPLLHVGADETVELGRGQTRAAVEAEGLGPVYVRFLAAVHARLAPLHRRLLFWGDVAMNDPAAVKQLPRDMIAVAWWYNPQPQGFAKWLKPYVDAGIETWVAPGVNNWNRVYPDNDYALRNIQRFVADGQAAHSTGMLNTVWNDDGEGLFHSDWYGLLFGAAAAWQPGVSSIEQYQAAYGPVFHADTTGKINAAQAELTAFYQLLDQAKVREATDVLYWLDPWSREGEAAAVKLRPLLGPLRLHAERALTLLAEARAANPRLREVDALDALELGARRLDFIGEKFETSDRIAALYAQAYAAASAKTSSSQLTNANVMELLRPLSGANGLCQDLRNGYSYGRVGYQELWLREYRPYWLPNVLARYDLSTQLWVTRGDAIAAQRSRWRDQHSLASAAELGLPSPAPSAGVR